MKKFLYMVAWVDGSDSAEDLGINTNVYNPSDLLLEYMRGNEHVNAWEITAGCHELAAIGGDHRAFHNNFTGCDTVTDCVELADGFEHPDTDHGHGRLDLSKYPNI